jgi:hypothetical protein
MGWIRKVARPMNTLATRVFQYTQIRISLKPLTCEPGRIDYIAGRPGKKFDAIVGLRLDTRHCFDEFKTWSWVLVLGAAALG